MTAEHEYRRRDDKRYRRNEYPQQTASDILAGLRLGEHAAQELFQSRNELPHQHDRMRQEVRIADDQIYDRASKKRVKRPNPEHYLCIVNR